MEQVVSRLLDLRDRKAELQEEIKRIEAAKEPLDNWLLDRLKINNSKSFRVELGEMVVTVMKKTRTSASPKDWEQVIGYIVANQAWELLQKRVSSTAVKERMDAGAIIPGVELFSEEVIEVRKQ